MSFDCTKVIPKKCKGDCCGIVPIPKQTWIKNRSKSQREIVEIVKIAGDGVMSDTVIPRTKNDVCPFLDKNYRCVIYDERPEVCRKFGDGTHPCLCCPFLEPDGKLKTK